MNGTKESRGQANEVRFPLEAWPLPPGDHPEMSYWSFPGECWLRQARVPLRDFSQKRKLWLIPLAQRTTHPAFEAPNCCSSQPDEERTVPTESKLILRTQADPPSLSLRFFKVKVRVSSVSKPGCICHSRVVTTPSLETGENRQIAYLLPLPASGHGTSEETRLEACIPITCSQRAFNSGQDFFFFFWNKVAQAPKITSVAPSNIFKQHNKLYFQKIYTLYFPWGTHRMDKE